jgi:peptidoglycan hydrolase CwlO-like protein
MIRLFIAILLLTVTCNASISSIDTDFYQWNDEYIKKNGSGNSSLDQLISDEVGSDVKIDLDNDTFNLNKYKQDLANGYEEAYDKYVSNELNTKIESLKTQYTQYTEELEGIKNQITNILNTTDLKGAQNAFNGLNLSLNLGSDETIQVFNGDKYSNLAGKTSSSKSSAVGGFTCACSPSLSTAFKDFDQHLMDNLSAIENGVTSLPNNIQANKEELSKQIQKLDNKISHLQLKLLEAKQMVSELNRELEIR